MTITSTMRCSRSVKELRILHVPANRAPIHESVDQFDFGEHPGLRTLCGVRMGEYDRKALSEKDPRFTRDLQLFGREIVADSGIVRRYPKGEILYEALEAALKRLIRIQGVMPVQTPAFFKDDHPLLRPYFERHEAGHFLAHSATREFFVRSSLRYGHLRILQDAKLTEALLPLRLFEMGRVFPRFEQRRTYVLKNSRESTSAELNIACRDIPQAQEEVLRLVGLSQEWMRLLGAEMDYVLQAEEGFFRLHENFIEETARRLGRPLILEIVTDDSPTATTSAFHLHDYYRTSEGRFMPMAFSKIDLETAGRFGIQYRTVSSTKNDVVLVEGSPCGLLERNLFVVLDQMEKQVGQNGFSAFPFWLSPTQIRLVPLGTDVIAKAVEWSKLFPFRVDIDDSTHSALQHRLHRAFEVERVPVAILIGRDEIESIQLHVKINEQRGENRLAVPQYFTFEQLSRLLESMQAGRPMIESTFPLLLSQQPSFHTLSSYKEPQGTVYPGQRTAEPRNPYVSGAGLKLHDAINYFGMSQLIGGKSTWRALDLGAATGGFTDCLLQHGCAEVHAVDLENNLADSLRRDSRVVYHPGVNLLYLDPSTIGNKFDLITVDVSLVSILQYLHRLKDLLHPDGLVLAMVKLAYEHPAKRAIEEYVSNLGINQGRRAGFRYSLPPADIAGFQQAIAAGIKKGEGGIIHNKAFARNTLKSVHKGIELLGFTVLETYDSERLVVGGEGLEVFHLMRPKKEICS